MSARVQLGRQEDMDRVNMLLQDPRPLEDKRDELAKVKTYHITSLVYLKDFSLSHHVV